MNCIECTDPEQQIINGSVFPAMFSIEAEDFDEFWNWVPTKKEWFRAVMLKHGAFLLRGAPIDSPEDFERFVDEGGFPRMPYVGGAAPRTEVTSRVLTSNESPPSEPIPFHHEMAQVPNPPAYIFFYCEHPPLEGGGTAIAHSVHTCELFYSVNAKFAEKIEEQGVRYVRVMPNQDDTSSPIGRSWRSTFQTQDRDKAEERMSAANMTWSWLPNGDVRTETTTLPAIRVEKRTGKKTFFNSVIAAYTGWIDKRNDPKKAVLCGDGSPVDGIALEETAKLMAKDSVVIRWQKGDVLCIDNRLVLHSREAFSGPRRILATISPH
jgi:alpha-ketoglutarate-dependent taurine dioxygenase